MEGHTGDLGGQVNVIPDEDEDCGDTFVTQENRNYDGYDEIDWEDRLAPRTKGGDLFVIDLIFAGLLFLIGIACVLDYFDLI